MTAGLCGKMSGSVSGDGLTPVGILGPDLERELRPALQGAGGEMEIDGMREECLLPHLGAVRLRLNKREVSTQST